MKIIRAEHLGMCFGVRDAIALALREAAAQPLTVLGDLVHNETVLARLQSQGVQFQNEAAAVTTSLVMVTAHGASEQKMTAIRNQGLQLIEATCPLVKLAHDSLKKLVAEGFHPVIIGKRDHVEVRGMTEDLDEFDVVLTGEGGGRFASASALWRDGANHAADRKSPPARAQALRERFPGSEVRFVDTVCQPTKQRQHAAVELAKQCNLVVVIGGAHSNNTHELVKTCSQFCARVHHVQTAADLLRDWFHADDTVGITAGTSTPDSVIAAVENAVHVLAGSNRELSQALCS